MRAANSIFVWDYLTTDGQEDNSDFRRLENLEFEIELTEKQALGAQL